MPRLPAPVVLALAVAVLLGLLAERAHGAAWAWPVSAGRALRPFSYGSDPFRAGWHRGLDLAAPPGTLVSAACPGRVRFAGTVAGQGGVVSVGCGPWRVTYLPLRALSVREGAVVRAGAALGRLARRPRHAGLHLGVRREGRRWAYVDPARFLGAAGAPSLPAVRPARPGRPRAPRLGPAPAPVPRSVPGARPAPALRSVPDARPAPRSLPSARSAPALRPVPGARTAPALRPLPSPRPAPRSVPDRRPAPALRPVPASRPATGPRPAPSTRSRHAGPRGLPWPAWLGLVLLSTAVPVSFRRRRRARASRAAAGRTLVAAGRAPPG